MALISIFPKAAARSDETPEIITVPVASERSQLIQRLQIGLAGLGAMVLLIGLAQVVYDRAQLSEADAVPAASATVAPGKPAPVQNDPLAEAGVVPDLPAEQAVPLQEQAVMPEQGNVQPRR